MADSSISHQPESQSEPQTVVLKPTRGLGSLNLRDLWVYRELAYFLTWRDIKVRYKQTVLGAAWAIIQPLLQMLLFNFLFGNIADIPTEGIPRPLFTYSALLPWNLFAKALSDAGRSLVASRNMITKVYFPRLIIPMSSVLSGVVDFGIAFLLLLGMMFYYEITPTLKIPDHRFGGWSVVVCVERKLPRRAVYYPLFNPVLAARQPGGVSGK
jgi:lipopolysaccharide transport system permease protein